MNHHLIRKFYREKDINHIEEKLMLLGNDKKIDPVEYMNVRLITTIMVFFLSLYIFNMGYIIAPALTIAYYYGYYYITIEKKIKERTKKIR